MNYSNETKRLDNCVGLHESWGNWENYLNSKCNFEDSDEECNHYISSNKHYIVLPDGEVLIYLGYHGVNAWNKIKAYE